MGTGGLKKRGLEILEGVVRAEDGVTAHGLALANAIDTLLRPSIGLAHICALLPALRGDRAVVAHEVLPTCTLPVHAQAPSMAIVQAAPLLAAGTNSAFVCTHDLAAVHTLEADVAHASPIHTQTIPCAIVGALPHLRIQGDSLAIPASKAVVAHALCRTVGRCEGAHAVTAAVIGTLRVFAVRSLPPLLTDAYAFSAQTVLSTTGRTYLVLAGILDGGAGFCDAPPRCALTGAR